MSTKTNNNFIDHAFNCGDETLYFTHYENEPWIGFTILDTKCLGKKAFKGWQHILFPKTTMKKLADFLINHNENAVEYFPCNCEGELLRVLYDNEDKMYYLDIFDNATLSLKKGIKTFASLDEKRRIDLHFLLDDLILNLD